MSALAIVLNGEVVPAAGARVSVLDRGFLYGDGVSEITRARHGVPFALERHLDRLVRSCVEMDLLPPTRESLRADAALALSCLQGEDGEHAALRFMVTRGVSGLGLDDVDPNAETTVLVTARTVLPLDSVVKVRVARAGIPFSGPHGVKTLAYTGTIAARVQARRRGFDDVLYVDAASRVMEGGSSNVLAIVNGRVRAPVLGALEGITRGVVLELLSSFGLPVDTGELTWDELLGADEAFLTSSLRGVAGISRIEETALPELAPVTLRLAQAYLEHFEEQTEPPARTS